MGSKGSAPVETKREVVQTNLPDYVRPYFERLLQRTEAESQRDYEPYGGQRIADPSADLLASEQKVRDIASTGIPGIAGATDAVGTGLDLISQGVGRYGIGERLVGEGSEIARGTLGQYGRAEDLLNRTLGTIDETKGMVRDARGDISDARGQLGRASTRTEQAFGFDPYQFSDARQFTGEERDRYMSPYMEGVIDVQKRRAREDFLKSMPQQAATAIGAGAFGGSREGVQRAEAQSDLLDRLSDIEATGRQQAFDRASQLFEADRRAEMGLDQTRAAERRQAEQLGLGAAQQLAGLGQARLGVGQALGGFGGQLAGFGQGIAGLGGQFAGVGSRLADLGARARAGDIESARLLEQIGKSQMARDQASLDMGYQDFLRQQGVPAERLGLFSSVLRGIPVQPSRTAIQYQASNPLKDILGTGIAALGAYKGMGYG